MTESTIETLAYELEFRTERFDRQLSETRKSLRDLTTRTDGAIPLTADAKGVARGVDDAKRKVKELPGVGAGNPAVVRIGADIREMERQLEAAKRAAADLGATRNGKPLQAKLTAEISDFQARIARATSQLERLSRQPTSVKLDADLTSLDASLKKSSLQIGAFIDRTRAQLDASPPVEKTTSAVSRLTSAAEQAGVEVPASATKIAQAFASPYTAVATLVTAIVTLSATATAAAAEFDTGFRKLRSSLPDTQAGVDALRDGILDLSLTTPRAADGLTDAATALAKMGTTDPKEIAASLRTLAFVGDALAETDLVPLAGQLDLIGDAFGLTAEEARQAFVQIVAMTKGRIPLEDLSGVLARSATRMAALGVSAQESAAAMTVLVDAGIASRQVTTGLIDLLDKAGDARTQALRARTAGNTAEARNLEAFADALDGTAVSSKGLVGALGGVYDALGQSRDRFRLAGLSLNDFQIAQKAAEATASGLSTRVLSYAESLEKLAPAAQVNRESASALWQVLKNELGAQLIQLGNVFLPTVNRGLTLMADLLSSVRRAAKDAAEDVPAITSLLDRGMTGFAARRAQPLIASVRQQPAMLEGMTLEQLRDLQGVFRRLQSTTDLGGEGLADALGRVESRLKTLAPALVEVKASMPTPEEIDRMNAAQQRSAEEAARAREHFEGLATAVAQYGQSLTTANRPAEAFRQRQADLAAELEKAVAKLPKAERAAARLKMGTLLGQLAEEGEKLKTTLAGDLGEKVTKILGAQSTDAIDALVRSYADLEKQLRDVAAAAEDLGTEEGRAQAQRARDAIPTLASQRDALIELERIAREFADAQQTITTFQSQTNANWRGESVTLADYRRALYLIGEEERRTREIRDKAEKGSVARAKAEELLVKLLERRKELEAQLAGGVAPVESMASKAIDLGNGIRDAAQFGLSLVQVLGKGNSELGQMLAGVTSIGAGLADVAAKAEKAGGFGALFSTGGGALSALSGVAQIAGGAVALAKALGGDSEAARKQREVNVANTAAVLALSKAIGDLSGSFSGDTLRGVVTGIERLFTDGRTASNFARFLFQGFNASIGQRYNNTSLGDPSLPDRIKIDPTKFFAAVGTSMEDVEAVAKKLGVQLDGTVGSYRRLREAIASADFAPLLTTLDGVSRRLSIIAQINGTTGDPLQGIADSFRSLVSLSPELAKAFNIDDVFSGAGREKLRKQVADLLQYVLSLDPESAELRDFVLNQLGGLSVDEFLGLFSGILTGLDGFKAGLGAIADAITVFGQVAQLTGLEGVAYLENFTATLAATMPQLAGLFDDLDLSTAAGVDAATQRIRDRYFALAADGITADEQKIVDALLNIFGLLEDLPDALDPLDQLLQSIDARFRIFGGSNADKFGSYGGILGVKFPTLAEILGPTFLDDIKSGEGRDKLKDAITSGINSILADGVITDDEKPLLAALEQLLGLVVGAIDDAAKAAQDAADQAAADAADAEERRRNALAVRGRDARLDTALDDLTGADAFRKSLEAYSAPLAAFFGAFDVDSVSGIDAATNALKQLRADLAAMTDAEILARFGMTRDEVLQAILDVDAGLDDLAGGLEKLSGEQRSFLVDLNLQFLDATGQGLEAVRIQTEIWVAQMIATAESLGLASEDVLEKIRAVADARIRDAVNRQANGGSPAQSAADLEAERRGYVQGVGVRQGDVQSAAVAPGPLSPRDTFVGSDVTRATETTVLRMVDYLALAYVEQRGTRIAVERIADALLSVATPALLTPALPAGVGTLALGDGVTGGVRAAGGQVFLAIHVNGPVFGMSAEDAGLAIARAALPHLNQLLSVDASVEARNAGIASLQN